jgi:hypothetical protein
MNCDEHTLPTADLVLAACRKFDEENKIVEQALTDLFSQYPRNDNRPHVLLKVVALNRLYSTQIFAVHDMARHIYEQHQDIDSALENKSPEIVDGIATFTVSTAQKEFTNYCFASKYCSWQKPASYPIWDSRVRRYLRCQRQTPFAAFLGAKPDRWERYQEFVNIMTKFIEFYGLGSFTFKEIDKFLWLYGGESLGMAAGRS